MGDGGEQRGIVAGQGLAKVAGPQGGGQGRQQAPGRLSHPEMLRAPPSRHAGPQCTEPRVTVSRLGLPLDTAPDWSVPPVGATSSYGNAYPRWSPDVACTIRA